MDLNDAERRLSLSVVHALLLYKFRDGAQIPGEYNWACMHGYVTSDFFMARIKHCEIVTAAFFGGQTGVH